MMSWPPCGTYILSGRQRSCGIPWPTRRSDSDLLLYAYYLRDARVAAALVDVANRHPTRRAQIAHNLVSMGEVDQALPLLREALLAGDPANAAAMALAELDAPAAGTILLEALRASPTALVIAAVGWHPSADAVDAIGALLDNPDLHFVGIDALSDGDPRGRRPAGGQGPTRRRAGGPRSRAPTGCPESGSPASVAGRSVGPRRLLRRRWPARPP